VTQGAIVAVVVAIALLGAAVWLSWRRPTLLFAVALASLAVRPQLFYGGPEVGYGWGVHHTLIVLALLFNALRYGIRRQMNWPLAALTVAFALSLALADLHPRLTVPFMVMSLGIFALPWSFPSVVLEPGSRRTQALVIALVPLLSVAIGAIMALAGIRPGFPQVHRLEGATGNPAAFAILAFAGFVVGLHEMSRRGRPLAGALAAVNLALVILSGTRMAIAASAVFLAAYLALAPNLRARLVKERTGTSAAVVVVVAALMWYWPILEGRLFDAPMRSATAALDADINLSHRDSIWAFYFKELTLSPIFGRGMGAGFVAAADWLPCPRKTPHNEYLHLLVNTGALGFTLCAAAIFVWYRDLLALASDNDRTFLIALVPALGVFAITEDVLVFATGLAVFAYLGILLTKRALAAPAPVRARRHRRARSPGAGNPSGAPELAERAAPAKLQGERP
jgi:O-antigen ligase